MLSFRNWFHIYVTVGLCFVTTFTAERPIRKFLLAYAKLLTIPILHMCVSFITTLHYFNIQKLFMNCNPVFNTLHGNKHKSCFPGENYEWAQNQILQMRHV